MWANQGWGDCRLQVNDVIAERWAAEMDSDFWLHGSADLFALLGHESSD